MNKNLLQIQKNLESIKQTRDDFEFWSARDLMEVLGYIDWRKFLEAIDRAKKSCEASNKNSQDHFVGGDKLVSTGSGASRRIEDVYLTRYGCYLVAQNGDPRKPQIALAQLYFLTQTRIQELTVERQKENKRLESRAKLRNTENKIEGTVYSRGIKLPVEFAGFKNKHIESLYGGISVIDLKSKKKIPKGRALADFDTDIELRAKDFALAMTDHNIIENNISGYQRLTDEVVKNSKATRQTLLSRGIIPENLKAEEDLKKVESRRKKEIKNIKNKKLS